jgi:hypothetical protein
MSFVNLLRDGKVTVIKKIKLTTIIQSRDLSQWREYYTYALIKEVVDIL